MVSCRCFSIQCSSYLTYLTLPVLCQQQTLQRFSELCENLRVSSDQILTLELTGWKPRLRNHCSSCNNISTCTSKHPPLYVTGDSLSQVRFPTCQFYQSKFDVTRPCNFHKVLKTSVSIKIFKIQINHSLRLSEPLFVVVFQIW